MIVVGLEAGPVLVKSSGGRRRPPRGAGDAHGRGSPGPGSAAGRCARRTWPADLRVLSPGGAPGPRGPRPAVRASGGRAVTRIRHAVKGTFPVAARAELPDLLLGPAHIGERDLDADRGPGVPRAPSGPTGARRDLSWVLVTAFAVPAHVCLFRLSWGGVIADRVDKRRLLYMTQSAAGVLALVLGLLTAGRLRAPVGGSSCWRPSSDASTCSTIRRARLRPRTGSDATIFRTP